MICDGDGGEGNYGGEGDYNEGDYGEEVILVEKVIMCNMSSPYHAP